MSSEEQVQKCGRNNMVMRTKFGRPVSDEAEGATCAACSARLGDSDMTVWFYRQDKNGERLIGLFCSIECSGTVK